VAPDGLVNALLTAGHPGQAVDVTSGHLLPGERAGPDGDHNGDTLHGVRIARVVEHLAAALARGRDDDVPGRVELDRRDRGAEPAGGHPLAVERARPDGQHVHHGTELVAVATSVTTARKSIQIPDSRNLNKNQRIGVFRCVAAVLPLHACP
jgi:hypothetical protein